MPLLTTPTRNFYFKKYLESDHLPCFLNIVLKKVCCKYFYFCKLFKVEINRLIRKYIYCYTFYTFEF